jgi:hypothetical protein
MPGIATSGITYYELYGSGGGEIAQDGTVTRYYQIAWTDLQAFVAALVGGFVKLNETNFYYTYPDRDPEWTTLYCQGTEFEGIGSHSLGAANQIAYTHAKVTAKYSPLKFAINGTVNNIYTEDLDWSQEVLSLPAGSFRSPGGGAIIQEPIQKVVPTTDYTLTIEGAPELPGGGHGAAIQAANASPLNSGNFLGASPKKVMFKGARATRTTDTRGAGNWRTALKFCYRPIEWTKVWDKTSGSFVEVETVNGGAQPLYGTSDLNLLLPR